MRGRLEAGSGAWDGATVLLSSSSYEVHTLSREPRKGCLIFHNKLIHLVYQVPVFFLGAYKHNPGAVLFG